MYIWYVDKIQSIKVFPTLQNDVVISFTIHIGENGAIVATRPNSGTGVSKTYILMPNWAHLKRHPKKYSLTN